VNEEGCSSPGRPFFVPLFVEPLRPLKTPLLAKPARSGAPFSITTPFSPAEENYLVANRSFMVLVVSSQAWFRHGMLNPPSMERSKEKWV